MLKALLRPLLSALGWLLSWPLALWVLFEEWGWAPLQALLARIGRWPGFRWVEQRVQALPPYPALLLFVLPSLLLLPAKLLALRFIAQGHVLIGAMVIVVAKIVGTALVARIFTLTQPALMQLPWFARVHTRWVLWKDRWFAAIRAAWPWRAARVIKRRIQRRWSMWRRPGGA